jgi:hypothetical protein
VPLPVLVGEAVIEGLLYRFIPNLEIYWEYDRDRPSPRAFRQRPAESDVSMFLDGLTTVDRLRQLQPTFGIYAIRVERLCAFGGMSIKYDPNPTQPEGNAKVAVTGINRRRAEHIARVIGERVHPPGPATETFGGVDTRAEYDR